LDGACTADRTCRTVKRGKETVARRINFPASKAIQFPTEEAVVTFKEISPPTVSQFGGPLGRVYNVCEKDSGQDTFSLDGSQLSGQELRHLVENLIGILSNHRQMVNPG
jgi:hypothetical protein